MPPKLLLALYYENFTVFRVSKLSISFWASSADETEYKLSLGVVVNKLSPGGNSLKVLYGEGPPERGTFFRLQVYERAGILLVKVYKRAGKSVIWVGETAQRAEQMNL